MLGYKNIFRVTVAVLLIFVGGYGIYPEMSHVFAAEKYYCPMHPSVTSDRPGKCPICHMDLIKHDEKAEKEDICIFHNCPMAKDGKPCPMLVVGKKGEDVDCPVCSKHLMEHGTSETITQEKKILYWTDPMLPGYKSENPGKSPMGMELVPVYEEETPASQAQASSEIEGYATVVLSQQKQQLIGVKTALVQKKDLMRIVRAVGTIAHDPELYQAQVEYIEAMKGVARAQQGGIPEVMDQTRRLAQSSEIKLRHMGLSEEMIKVIAESAKPDQSLLYTQPGGTMWVYAQVFEYELPSIFPEQDVKVEIPTMAAEMFLGKVKSIDRTVDQATRSIRVRIKVDDPKGMLKPDMYVNVLFEKKITQAVSVPTEAVFDTGERKLVFLVERPGVFQPRDVIVGEKAGNDYEVKNGLEEGDEVVVSGNFLIDSESRLKSALQEMSQEEKSEPVSHQGHGGH